DNTAVPSPESCRESHRGIRVALMIILSLSGSVAVILYSYFFSTDAVLAGELVILGGLFLLSSLLLLSLPSSFFLSPLSSSLSSSSSASFASSSSLSSSSFSSSSSSLSSSSPSPPERPTTTVNRTLYSSPSLLEAMTSKTCRPVLSPLLERNIFLALLLIEMSTKSTEAGSREYSMLCFPLPLPLSLSLSLSLFFPFPFFPLSSSSG